MKFIVLLDLLTTKFNLDLMKKLFFFFFKKSYERTLMRQFRAKLLIPFRSGRNGWNILYRYANRFKVTSHSTSDKILGCFGSFRAFRDILVNTR